MMAGVQAVAVDRLAMSRRLRIRGEAVGAMGASALRSAASLARTVSGASPWR